MFKLEARITGVMIQYYVTCKRELWFYVNQINMNYDNDDINIGKLIHEKTYSREKKEIRLDNIVLDYIKDKDGLTIFEIKKSSKLTHGAKYQLYYYLYNMKKMNLDAKGMLVYPKERKREEIILTPEIEKEIEEIIDGIGLILNEKYPPKSKNKPFCKKCSFNELCKI